MHMIFFHFTIKRLNLKSNEKITLKRWPSFHLRRGLALKVQNPFPTPQLQIHGRATIRG